MKLHHIKPEKLQYIVDSMERLMTSHIVWLNIFNKQLICNTSDQSFAESHKECEFGKWYDSIQTQELTSDDEFIYLGSIHEKLHAAGSLLLTISRDGGVVTESEYQSFSEIESEFIRKLESIYYAINSTWHMTDNLTQLPNRGLLQSILEREYEQFERMGGEHCIAFADIDHFKNINDVHGHLAGDEVLQAVSQQLLIYLRKYDLVGRYGGEEFLLYLPNTSLDNAEDIIERIRQGIHDYAIELCDGESINVTFSFGLSQFTPECTLSEVIRNADNAMYFAKKNGRDNVSVHDKEKY